MSRTRQRVCLQDGLSLHLNKLRRGGLVQSAGTIRTGRIFWRDHSGEEIANAIITAGTGQYRGSLRIQLGSLDQWVELETQIRHFGGRQWYFVCPVTHRHCSVLWMPPGGSRFCSRHAWKGQVAYASQFESPADRAHRGKAAIKARLIGECDPDEWELPPKPRWMRWRTYAKHVEKFNHYEELLDLQCF
jgi:hypothetical protein